MKNILAIALFLFTTSSFSQKLEFDGATMDFSKSGTLSVYFITKEKTEFFIYENGKQISYTSCTSCVGWSESWPKEGGKYTIVYIKGGKKETKEIVIKNPA